MENINQESRVNLNKDNSGILFGVIIIMSFLSTIIVIAKRDNTGYYSFLFLLPLGHMITMLLCKRFFNDIFNHIARLLLVLGFFIRNVLTPLFLALGNFEPYRKSSIRPLSSNEVLFSALLMVYETIVIFFFCSFWASHFNNNRTNTNNKETSRTIPSLLDHFSVYSFVVFAILGIMLYSIIRVPSISKLYHSLWASDAETLIQSEVDVGSISGGIIDRLLFSFFDMFFLVMQIVGSSYLIVGFRKKMGNSIIAVVFSFVVIGINTFFVTDTNANTVFVMAILFVLIRNTFPERKKGITIFGVSIVSFILILMMMIRFSYWSTGSEENPFVGFSYFMNAYFPGINNVCVIWRVKVPNKFTSFYYDFYKSLPLQSMIPPLMQGTRLSTYYSEAAGANYQIMPFCAQFYFYFSLLGPFFQLPFIYSALKCEKNIKNENNFLYYVAYLSVSVVFGIGCSMYNMTNLLTKLWKLIIPCLIFGKMSNWKIK